MAENGWLAAGYGDIELREYPESWYSPAMRDLLKDVFSIDAVREKFFITGGTCLSAFYFGHRQSEDIDLFSGEAHNDFTDIWKEAIYTLNDRWSIRPYAEPSKTFASFQCSNKFDNSNAVIKLDFVFDTFAFKGPRPVVELDGISIAVDSMDNLFAGKFSAFLSRCAEKDIIDMEAILAHAKDPKIFLMNLLNVTAKRDSLADDLNFIKERFQQIKDVNLPALGSISQILEELDTERK